ncbi:MAG: GHMP family kinase ATP-binding protein [Terriglobia bacterium]
MEKQTISVRVPATVGNFGGAAECGSLALDASLNVKVTRRLDGQVGIRYFGENGERVPRDRSNLVVRALEAALHFKQRQFTGADLEIYSSVPVAVGLGSSTAAVLAGLIAANLLYRLGLDEKSLFDLAAIFEHRGGNLRAAWSGGFVACVEDASRMGPGAAAHAPLIYERTAVPENFILSVVVPETFLVPGTRKAGAGHSAGGSGKPGRSGKRAQGGTLGHEPGRVAGKLSEDKTAQRLNRAAALTEFFARHGSGNPIDLDATLPPTCEKNVAGLEEALRVRTPGLLSVFLCGSGPAVGVFAGENGDDAVHAVRQAFAKHNVESSCFEFRPSNMGALDWNAAYRDLALPLARELGDSLRKSNPLPV